MIRPPRREEKINPNEVWQQVLEPAVQQILTHGAPQGEAKFSFTELYYAGYRMVTQGYERTLNRRLTDTCRAYLEQLQISAQSSLLDAVCSLWMQFQLSLQHIEDVFLYYNKSSQCRDLASTDQMGKELFRDIVLLPHLSQLCTQFVAEMDRERKGLVANHAALRASVDLLSKVGEGNEDTSGGDYYNLRLRPMLLEAAQQFYANERLAVLAPLEQLHQLSSWLTTESERGTLYLPPETTKDIVKHIEENIVDGELQRVLQLDGKLDNKLGGLQQWIDEQNLAALKLCAQLEQRVPTKTLASQLSSHLEHDQQIVNQTSHQPIPWVAHTVELAQKYENIGETTKQQAPDRQLGLQLEVAHRRAVARCARAEELLALYMNEFLKKSASFSEESVEPAMADALRVYTLVENRDEFGKHYQRLMARRLLNSSSRSRDLELTTLQRLKLVGGAAGCGGADAYELAKYEKMIANMDESRSIFHGSTSIAPGIVATNVHVLNQFLWPRSMQVPPSYNLQLPQELETAKQAFERFHASVKPDRILRWNFALSNVDVKLNMGSKTYLVSVPLACMAILALFEEDEVMYTTQQIEELTGIPRGGQLERHLMSLYSTPGTQLLQKCQPGDNVAASDQFTFNNDFTSPKPRFKIKVVSAKGSGLADSADAAALAEDRAEHTQATVMRVMKKNQQLHHTALVADTVLLLQPRFRADNKTVKRAIEVLLEKNYLVRADDGVTYHYIA